MFHPFWTREHGVATVDYVAVLAALVGLGVWLADETNEDLTEHSANIRGEMQDGLFETAWDNQLAVLPDTEAGDECDGAGTCGGDPTGGGGTDPDPNPDPDPTPDPDPDPTPDPDPDPDPTPDPDPDPTPDPDPDPTPDPDPDPTPDPDPDPNAGNDPFPPPASGQVAGCPNNFYNGEPLVQGPSDFGNGNDHTTAHSGYTDLRSCSGGMPYRRGYFDANPTFTMYLSDMDSFDTVQFLVEASNCDTTLLIRDASGTFFFNDDYNYPNHLRSRLRLTDTANLNGRVDIWIGAYSPSSCTTRMEVRGW